MPPTGIVKMANSQARVFAGLTPLIRRLTIIAMAIMKYKIKSETYSIFLGVD
jgi:hypothetical protein